MSGQGGLRAKEAEAMVPNEKVRTKARGTMSDTYQHLSQTRLKLDEARAAMKHVIPHAIDSHVVVALEALASAIDSIIYMMAASGIRRDADGAGATEERRLIVEWIRSAGNGILADAIERGDHL